MTYPFVQAHNDYGHAKGPRLAAVWHMAEGGGTVAYLSKPNPNGVSVHFVIERSGRTVQMLRLNHANGSIRPTAIRTSDDKPFDWQGVDIVYGASAARAVLGDWHRDPNSATIGVEIEGYAKDGPNGRQADAMAALHADLAARFPGIRSLAHRDFADYKRCPGQLIPWDRVGGHGPEVDTLSVFTSTAQTGHFVTVAGQPIRGWSPAPDGWKLEKTWTPQGAYTIGFTRRLALLAGDAKPSSLVFVPESASKPLGGLCVSTADIDEIYDPTPLPDCSTAIADAVAAAITADRAKARVTWEDVP